MVRRFRAVIEKKYGRQSRLLTPRSEKRFNIILAVWFGLAYVLAQFITVSGLSFSDCCACEWIVRGAPAVKKGSVGSLYPEAMQYVWTYILLTLPILFVVFFVFVTDFNHRVLATWAVWFLLGMALMIAYPLFIGMTFGGPDATARLSVLYHKYLLFSTFVAFAAGAVFVSILFHLTHHVIGLRKQNSHDGKENSRE